MQSPVLCVWCSRDDGKRYHYYCTQTSKTCMLQASAGQRVASPGGRGDPLAKASCWSRPCSTGVDVGILRLIPGISSCTISQAWRVHLKIRTVMGLYDLWLCWLAISWPLQVSRCLERTPLPLLIYSNDHCLLPTYPLIPADLNSQLHQASPDIVLQ